MNATGLIPAAQSQTLLREIEQQARDECRALLMGAERDARAIIGEAYASARRRMHDAIVELRREGEHRLARAKAQVETETRRSAQRRAVEAVREAWPFIVDALVARWHDPAARRAWTDAVVRLARDRLRVDDWVVEHPAAWSAEEQEHVRQALATDGDAIAFTPDRELAAGIRIKARDAVLDATPDGLLADKAGIAALLLAELDRPDGSGGAAPDR